MVKFISAIAFCAMGAFLASCDLQPKISSLPDSVGDFISSRYPALLADPAKEPEIYNSAVSDYGIYASPELYGSGDMDDYVNYADINDYTMPAEPTKTEVAQEMPIVESKPVVETESENVASTPTESKEHDKEQVDILEIPEYKSDELNVPARAAAGTVVVRRGDTLYAIARANGTTVDAMATENKLVVPYSLRIGQVLNLPKEAPEKTVATETKKAKVEKPAVAAPKVEPEKKAVVEPKGVPEKTATEKPVAKPEPKNVRVPLKTITVARGDTLYSLSRKYAVPVNDLAVMNELRPPFALNVGQKLRVPDLPDVIAEKSAPAPAQKPATKTAGKKTETKPVKKETKTESVKKPEPKKSEQPKTTPVKETTKSKPAATVAKTETPKIVARSSSKFTWPVRGTILSHYGAKNGGLYNDGINIGVAAGTTVVAAENGVVAYAGNEVRGMGNLVIIQHSDGWMTVYAHLNSMSVRRGVRVSVGQKIGTVGQTGKVNKPQLHFEIRKGTKAYNPVNYLKK
ncbi:MAG: peptidoglycan DD-metalloendopeptidase family protein [Alphaproteobacteria bacterium]|nr:peptidoglycan DD-metalloendopeptidase family protein [Alphaproteobacteria bacterium]